MNEAGAPQRPSQPFIISLLLSPSQRQPHFLPTAALARRLQLSDIPSWAHPRRGRARMRMRTHLRPVLSSLAPSGDGRGRGEGRRGDIFLCWQGATFTPKGCFLYVISPRHETGVMGPLRLFSEGTTLGRWRRAEKMALWVRDPLTSRAELVLLPPLPLPGEGGGLVRDLLRSRCEAQVNKRSGCSVRVRGERRGERLFGVPFI